MTAPNLSGPPSQRGMRLRLARDLAAGLALLGLALWLFCSPRTLKPGHTFTRTLVGPAGEESEKFKQVHRYQARLSAGDFLQVTVDQSVDGEKMDALVLLLGPDGQEIARADSLDGSRFQEEIAAVAETPGRHLLTVGWSGSGPRAPYRLRVKALRPAGPAERLRAEALRLSQGAANLAEESGPLPRQVALRREALRLWRKLGDREREAVESYQIGGALKTLGQLEPAIASLNRSIAAWEEVGNQNEQAMVLYELGMAEIHRDRPAAARQAFTKGLALDAKPDTRLSLLLMRGRLHINLGDRDLGIRDCHAALALARELKQASTEANILNELGYAYRSQGRWDDAILHLNQALETARTSGVQEIEMSANNSLGGVYASLGDWEQAIEHYQEALKLIRQDDDLRLRYEARILNNLALAHHRSRELQRAWELFQQVLDLEQLDPGTEATVLNNMAFVQLEWRNPRQALDLCDRSRKLASGDPDWEPGILEAEGIAYLRLGEHGLARQRLGRALALNEERNDRFRQASVTLVQGMVARAEGDLDTAVRYARRAVTIVESFRTGVEDDNLRASFLASKRDPYDFYVDTLVEIHKARPAAGFDAESLRVNEMSRARSLLDLLNQAVSPAGREDAPGHSPPPVQAPRPLALAEIQSQVLGEDTLLLEYALGEQRSYLWAVTPGSLHVFTLPSKGAIERIARSFYDQILVRTRDGWTEAEAEQADARAEDLAAELSQIILEPVANAGLLHKKSTVLVVSDGALQYIPFSALPLPSSPAAGQHRAPVLMVEEHEIVHLPSASVLASLREELANRQPPARTLALFADPVFTLDDSRVRPPGFLDKLLKPRQAARRRGEGDDKLYRLTWSEKEADWILELVDPSMVLERRSFDATVAAVTSAPLDQYRYLHFATHGRIDASRPERSSLVLSLYDEKLERQEPGHLRLPDVYNLRLNADLVVLSACETALGQEIRGEGLIGLTRGFMYAGSRRVLASLWSVDDRVTAELMQRLYEGILREKRSPAAALRQAQRDMLRNEKRKSPYYWAGFSLQGEWR